MSEKFFEVDTEAFKKFLSELGFTQLDCPGEIVYVRHHHKSRSLMVKVYTTIPPRRKKARACGSDAVRIAAVFDNGIRDFGIGRFPRVYRRVPDHLMTKEEQQKFFFDRVLKRMRIAYKRCNDWLKAKKKNNL
jgi:hypothetical protein